MLSNNKNKSQSGSEIYGLGGAAEDGLSSMRLFRVARDSALAKINAKTAPTQAQRSRWNPYSFEGGSV